MISYKDYMCLVSQEDDPYTRAVTSLPRKAKKDYQKAADHYKAIQSDFMDQLEKFSPDLLKMYLKVEAAATDRSGLLADAMYLMGITDTHQAKSMAHDLILV